MKLSEFEKNVLEDLSEITDVDYTSIEDARELFVGVFDMIKVIEKLRRQIRELKERPDEDIEDEYEDIKLRSLGYDV